MAHEWRVLLLLSAFVVLTSGPTASQSREVTLRIVVVSTAAEAQRIAERARGGEDFAGLARSESIDPTASEGGLLGPLDPATLRPELRDAVQALGVGAITPVVPVATGYAIVQLVSGHDRGHGLPAAARPPDAVNPGLAAVGSVKYVLAVSGLTESQAAFDRFAKPEDWSQHPRAICDARVGSVRWAVELLSSVVAPGSARGAALPPGRMMEALYSLGQFHAYDGRMDAAIEQFERARAIAAGGTSPEGATAAEAMLRLDQSLGVAWLQKSQMDNGIFHTPGDSCLLSPAGLVPLARKEGSVKAVEYFERYLASKPDELEVQWLLNIAYMTLGGYPHKVPPAHLIPPASLASAEDIGRFVDVADEAGLRSFSFAGGLIVDDFDNDGRFDVVTSSFDACAPMRFFRRLPDGGFAESAEKAGLASQIGGLNAMQTDYDNNGCLDILLLRGGWDRSQRKSLLRNNCDGTFTDVTIESGLARPATATQAGVWTDIDNDGFLDLFIGSEDAQTQLFVNNRDGTFTDIAAAAGVQVTAFVKGVTTIDYDNDGWQDLYVSNYSGDNFLFRNNGNRTFTETGRTLGVTGSQKGFVTWSFDYDNDGWQDLFATSYYTSVTETARTYLGLPPNATTLKLYRNLGGAGFRDVTHEVGLAKVFMPMGSNFGDVDNDGFLDMYLGTGNPSYASLVPSVLLRNREGKSFVDITASSGTGELHKGHGVAFADLDGDGDDELLFEVGGAVPGDAHALRLFKNPGHGNDWLRLKLVGVKSNRAAIGARIAVTAEGPAGRRTFHRTVTSGGSFGASPLEQHVGLGKADRVVDVEIWWPATNTRQRFTDIAKNQILRIEEFATSYTKVQRTPQPLGKREGS